MEDLLKRGLHEVELIVSDSHQGLRKALKAIFPSVRWQRCLFHLAQNARAQASSGLMQAELCNVVKEIYQATDR